MRRPAPPLPTEDVVDLDYGSADGPSDPGAQLVVADELDNGAAVKTSANEVDSALRPTDSTAAPSDQPSRERRLPLAYDTDALDPASLQPSNLPSRTAASNALESRQPAESFSRSFATAVLGHSASPGQQDIGSELRGGGAGLSSDGVASRTTSWQSDSRPHPPPPINPPPALAISEDQYRSVNYAYDPNAPDLRPSLYPLAAPTLHAGSNAFYAAFAPQNVHAGPAEPYAHPVGAGLVYGPDLAYDPHAPHNLYMHGPAQEPFHFFPPYPLAAASYPAGHHERQPHQPTSHMDHQMNRFQLKRLHKQQKKKEKKQRRREQKLAAPHAAAYDVASGSVSASPSATQADAHHVWVQDGEAQASAMIHELHARGVPPVRLVERGVPLRVVEDCCTKLGISPHVPEARKSEAITTPPPQQHAAPAIENAGYKNSAAMAPPEDELLSREESNHALTPLEELRRKVLASRLAKAAAASDNHTPKESEHAVSSADQTSDQTTSVSGSNPVFDRTTTSGEAGALLSQIAESIRSLLRPSNEATMTASRKQPAEETPLYPAASGRKRSYRDVDAVDEHHADVTADLTGGESTALLAPSRRQRISYADNFSRAAVAPSGEVDLDAPVPNLPDFSETMARPSDQAITPMRRRRPVAADFDTAEYRPQIMPSSRFLDVPSGLNTVIDLSDDEVEDEELDAFHAANGWRAARPIMDPRDVLALRKKTATEHYDTFCTLNGLQPVGRAVTPQHEGSANATETAEAGISAAMDGLLAQLAASGATSAGSSTPSRDELLRKEFEIKQLTRKIQLMEERKNRQQTSSASPPVSPLPSRHLQKMATSQTLLTTDSIDGANVVPRLADASSGSMSARTQAAAEAVAGANAPVQTSSAGSGSSLRLDPALSKQREHLLALLASKRKNAGTAPHSEAKPSIDTVHSGTEDHAPSEPTQVQPLHESKTGIAIEAAKAEASERRMENFPPPSVVSRYRPLVPTLFQSVATRFRSYLPPSLGFSSSRSTAAASSAPAKSTAEEEAASERTSIKWCPREADGDECNDAGCSQRHVAEFDGQSSCLSR